MKRLLNKWSLSALGAFVLAAGFFAVTSNCDCQESLKAGKFCSLACKCRGKCKCN